ncbi:MAG TPA: threonine ammonia-lyase [Natrialbaceae archaeon]|nr:threonine ammonia-lyase [Natrialbaceae archaeon]
MTVTLADVERARERQDDLSVVKRTPLEHSRSFSDFADADVHLKMEHLQRTGSFKTRGAYNKIAALADEGEIEQIVAASAGNHAQGVAIAATKLGMDATIVMPKSAPQAKVDATRGYGAEVVLHGRNFPAALERAKEMAEDPAVEFIPPYDDPLVIAGQGTIGMEIHEDLPAVDTVVAPIGGGGLISGVSAALAELAPDVRVVGVQAEEAATVPESLDKGIPTTIDDVDTVADGIATGGVSDLTFDLIEEHVDDVVVVSDQEIATAILLLLQRTKQLVEGAGAASVAAIMSEDLDVSGETVVPILSGGNLDMTTLQRLLSHALASNDQLVQLQVRVNERPGVLQEIATTIAEYDGNIREVTHERAVGDLDVGEADIIFTVETGGSQQSTRIKEAIEALGHEVKRQN